MTHVEFFSPAEIQAALTAQHLSRQLSARGTNLDADVSGLSPEMLKLRAALTATEDRAKRAALEDAIRQRETEELMYFSSGEGE